MRPARYRLVDSNKAFYQKGSDEGHKAMFSIKSSSGLTKIEASVNLEDSLAKNALFPP